MQFNVPQFTDVEDQVIGPLTVKQFLILLGAGGLTFLSYSLSKNTIVTVLAGIVVTIPALIFAFGTFNGRKLYQIIPVFFKFFSLPKKYVFIKQAVSQAGGISKSTASKQMQTEEKKDKDFPELPDDIHSRLKKIQYQLEKRSSQEQKVVETLK